MGVLRVNGTGSAPNRISLKTRVAQSRSRRNIALNLVCVAQCLRMSNDNASPVCSTRKIGQLRNVKLVLSHLQYVLTETVVSVELARRQRVSVAIFKTAPRLHVAPHNAWFRGACRRLQRASSNLKVAKPRQHERLVQDSRPDQKESVTSFLLSYHVPHKRI